MHPRQQKEGKEKMADPMKTETISGGASELTRLPQLAASILEFDFSWEIAHLRQEDSWRRGTGRSSKTLAKYPDLRFVLTLLQAGAHVKEHKTAGRISIQGVMGRMRLHVPQRTVELTPGKILVLDTEVPHDVEAVEESAFLLTICAAAQGK
jgi:quercetin dioxygenase-like cupin family protein